MTGKNIFTFSRHQAMVSSIAWSPNGTRIASSDYDGTVNVWDAFTGLHTLFDGGAGGVTSVTWSPDGTRIASAGSAATEVSIWNATNGNILYTYLGNRGGIRDIAWSPNGKYIASGDAASEIGTIGTVKVWLAS